MSPLRPKTRERIVSMNPLHDPPAVKVPSALQNATRSRPSHRVLWLGCKSKCVHADGWMGGSSVSVMRDEEDCKSQASRWSNLLNK